MKRKIITAVAIATLAATPVLAAGDITRTDVQEVRMEMGSKGSKMYFEPSELTFETGKAYKLVLVNVDKLKHEVTLGEATEKMFTRKVEVLGPDGKMLAEIKGAVHEIELAGGATAERYFVPLQPVKKAETACELPGHKEAGMHGLITFE